MGTVSFDHPLVMTDHHGWITAVFFGGLCVLSFLWTLCTAPGFKVKGKHVLLTGARVGSVFVYQAHC